MLKTNNKAPDQQRKVHHFVMCMWVCVSVTKCFICVGPRYPGAAVIGSCEGMGSEC